MSCSRASLLPICSPWAIKQRRNDIASKRARLVQILPTYDLYCGGDIEADLIPDKHC